MSNVSHAEPAPEVPGARTGLLAIPAVLVAIAATVAVVVAGDGGTSEPAGGAAAIRAEHPGVSRGIAPSDLLFLRKYAQARAEADGR